MSLGRVGAMVGATALVALVGAAPMVGVAAMGAAAGAAATSDVLLLLVVDSGRRLLTYLYLCFTIPCGGMRQDCVQKCSMRCCESL